VGPACASERRRSSRARAARSAASPRSPRPRIGDPVHRGVCGRSARPQGGAERVPCARPLPGEEALWLWLAIERLGRTLTGTADRPAGRRWAVKPGDREIGPRLSSARGPWSGTCARCSESSASTLAVSFPARCPAHIPNQNPAKSRGTLTSTRWTTSQPVLSATKKGRLRVRSRALVKRGPDRSAARSATATSCLLTKPSGDVRYVGWSVR
jgi:hypothetical protein